ncbi:MAG: nucleotidyltransferase family protein [Elusimicrobia bacterium]|nr:nucleotidyltransferase family protein [Elusimicrobiota bacterium]
MKAMILAAGLGTRLRPLTNSAPKALVEINGISMLEITVKKLVGAGVKALIINVHHLGEKIKEFLAEKRNFNIRIEISREQTLLETGGGLKNAAWFFDDGEPFFLHNVDAFTEINLKEMYEAHVRNRNMVTLAVQNRESSRKLIFDKDFNLIGFRHLGQAAPSGMPESKPMAFNSVHVISPEFFEKMTETGVFSIMETYFRMAKEGIEIKGFDAGNVYFKDIGTPAKLEELRRHQASKDP